MKAIITDSIHDQKGRGLIDLAISSDRALWIEFFTNQFDGEMLHSTMQNKS